MAEGGETVSCDKLPLGAELLPHSDPRGNNFAKGGKKFLKDTAAKRVEAAEMEAELSADVKNLQGRRMKETHKYFICT